MRAQATHTGASDIAATAATTVGKLQSEIEAASDPRHAYMKVKQAISEYRVQGKLPPAELLRLERNLALDCIEESQGR